MKTIHIFILILLLTIGCKQKPQQNSILNPYDYILFKYSDSTYNKPLDSLYIKENDTIYFTKQFPIKGYFKIYDSNKEIYSQGEVNKDKKTGKWYTFQKDSKTEKWVLIKESHYDHLGHLEGISIFYNPDTKRPIAIHRYVDDEENGIQQEYYPNGKLHIQYEKDNQGKFINTYIVYTRQGTELYKANLGNEGTGYIKYYNQENDLEWEGNFINKKKQGWHKGYISDYGSDKSEIVERKFYKDDDILIFTQIFLPFENISIPGHKGYKADSITRTYTNNQIKLKYYSNGKMMKEELEK